jgi:hypothetical protein
MMLVLGVGLVARDLWGQFEIDPDDPPAGMPEWLIDSPLCPQDLERLLNRPPL